MGKREVFFDGKTLMNEGNAEVVHLKEMALNNPKVLKTGSYRKEGISENIPSI